MPGGVMEGTKREAAKSGSVLTLHRSMVCEDPEWRGKRQSRKEKSSKRMARDFQ